MRVLICLALLTLACSGPAVPAESPEALLERLYQEHAPQRDRGMAFDDAVRLRSFFTPDLTALFLADAECARETGEICSLDYDPIFAAQDFDQQPLALTIEKVSDTRFKATYTNLGRRSQFYEVKETPEGWRIDDIVYPDGTSLKVQLSSAPKDAAE